MGNSPPYFISLTLRKIALRLIILSSLFSFILNVIILERILQWPDYLAGGEVIGLSLIPISVWLHHILRLWPREIWTVKSDLIYSAIELGFVTGYLICEIILLNTSDHGDIMMCIFALTIFWLSIFASFIFTIWNLRTSQYRYIHSTYYFIENHDTRDPNLGKWTLLFGENTLKKRFATDQMFVRGLRAALGIICLIAMITLAHLILIIQPREQEIYFQKMSDGKDPRYDVGNVTLRVFLQIGVRDSEAFLLPELIDLDVSWTPETQQISCNNSGIRFVNRVTCNVQSPFSQPPPDNLIIKVNYTRALEEYPIPSLRTGVNLCFNDANLFGDNGGLTPPIQLYPGFHLFGTTYYSYLDTYANSRDPTFGIPHYHRDLLLHVQALIPDPNFTDSSSDNTTATLRLTYQGGIYAVQSSYIVHTEKSSTSVLSGFALLGGIWTFINGLFATVFGCSLLLVLFGIKPLSIYGVVHLFQRRRSLVDGGYTLSADEQTRTIGVLREHLLDDDHADIPAGEFLGNKDRDEEERKPHDII